MTHSLAGSVSISSNKQISIEAFGVTGSLTRSTKLNIYCWASKLNVGSLDWASLNSVPIKHKYGTIRL